jgi:hypothetical protein
MACGLICSSANRSRAIAGCGLRFAIADSQCQRSGERPLLSHRLIIRVNAAISVAQASYACVSISRYSRTISSPTAVSAQPPPLCGRLQRLVQFIHQQPRAPVRHVEAARCGRDRTVLPDRFQQRDLARAERDVAGVLDAHAEPDLRSCACRSLHRRLFAAARAAFFCRFDICKRIHDARHTQRTPAPRVSTRHARRFPASAHALSAKRYTARTSPLLRHNPALHCRTHNASRGRHTLAKRGPLEPGDTGRQAFSPNCIATSAWPHPHRRSGKCRASHAWSNRASRSGLPRALPTCVPRLRCVRAESAVTFQPVSSDPDRFVRPAPLFAPRFVTACETAILT